MSSKHAPAGRTPSSQTWHLQSYVFDEIKSLVDNVPGEGH